MNNHILLLHIGIPKTGTSALQRFLTFNAEILKEYGWQYPDLKSAIGNAESYYIEYINATVLYREEKRLDVNSENWVRSWNYLKQELTKYNVILSMEHIFEWCEAENILKEIMKEYHNVKVIIYLRRQDIFLESFWAQLVKSDNWVKGFEESIPELMHHAHYLSLLNRIENIIGKRNLIVRVYEKRRFKGDRNDICSDFLDAIGIKPDWSQFCTVGLINHTLLGNYLEIKRVFNSLHIFDDTISDEYKGFFLRVSRYLTKEKKVMGFFRGQEMRENFLNQFGEENRMIAEQFIDNSDGVLFRDMNMDIPFSGVKATAFEEDLIKLFGSIICDTRNKMDFLERNARKNTEITINEQKKDRKIVYFGGGNKCKELLQKYNWRVEMIIDNDKTKSGEQINGVPVTDPSSIDEWENLFIIITCVDAKEIVEQLNEIGLIKDRDFVLANEFLY